MKTQIILSLFLILLLLFILRIQKETFIDNKDIVHNKLSCRNHPFEYDKECDAIYHDGIYTPHINNVHGGDTPIIHMVDPNNPCCLRSCINDFTITPENSKNSKNSYSNLEYGTLKSFFNNPDNLDTIQLSQCDKCIKNFSKAIEILNTNRKCSR